MNQFDFTVHELGACPILETSLLGVERWYIFFPCLYSTQLQNELSLILSCVLNWTNTAGGGWHYFNQLKENKLATYCVFHKYLTHTKWLWMLPNCKPVVNCQLRWNISFFTHKRHLFLCSKCIQNHKAICWLLHRINRCFYVGWWRL